MVFSGEKIRRVFMNFERLFVTTIENETVKICRKQGKKIIGTICCHVPEELFHAANVLPMRIRGNRLYYHQWQRILDVKF